jgi:hypothetical protein
LADKATSPNQTHYLVDQFGEPGNLQAKPDPSDIRISYGLRPQESGYLPKIRHLQLALRPILGAEASGVEVVGEGVDHLRVDDRMGLFSEVSPYATIDRGGNTNQPVVPGALGVATSIVFGRISRPSP